MTIPFANGSFVASFLSRPYFSTGRSLLKEKSYEFRRSQGIFKPKRQDQRKSAAATGSHPPNEKSGKTPQSQNVLVSDCQDQAAFTPIEKSGKTPHGQSALVSDCQDQLKKAEGPTDFGLIFPSWQS
jgi:hypothetical protein